MTNVSHWGLPQYLLILLQAMIAYADIQTLPERVREKVKNAGRHPVIVASAVAAASLIQPVIVICLTCWGGFFA